MLHECPDSWMFYSLIISICGSTICSDQSLYMKFVFRKYEQKWIQIFSNELYFSYERIICSFCLFRCLSFQTHKADNLLKSETYRKWKSSAPGERQNSIILQVLAIFLKLHQRLGFCTFQLHSTKLANNMRLILKQIIPCVLKTRCEVMCVTHYL